MSSGTRPPPARGLEEPRLSPLFWTRRASLTARILVVNIIALALLGGSLFYLDSFRKQIVAERFKLAGNEANILAAVLDDLPQAKREAVMVEVGATQRLRIRLYDRKGALIADSFTLARKPAFELVDPDSVAWYEKIARMLDRGMDFVIGAAPIPAYEEPAKDTAAAWQEIVRAREGKVTVVTQRYAPDRTPVITSAALIPETGGAVLTTRNARDVTERVRMARQDLAIIVGVTLVISIQLSLFLARTIVQPLRTLVRAAVRVRLGRDREVEVPRLPERRDEIGMLARAISDMTAALRHRIDAVDHFAADVAHEIKNPLASLRSALESLDKVEDPELRRELAQIAMHDLRRIDRLVTEISDASRIDAEMSRATFELVDMAALLKHAIEAREGRNQNDGRPIHLTRRGSGQPEVLGVPARLERVIENLLDNAVSFSPPDGVIRVELETLGDIVRVSVSDDGPGVPLSERENVFERFHSDRPEGESFGNHSGLGLAIARTISEAHFGTLTIVDRRDGKPGACLRLELPRAST